VWNFFKQARTGEAAHLRTGQWGEAVAERFLRRHGFRVLARRWRHKKDELDLVVREGDTLVFVEVKTRASEIMGRPFSAVDRAKRRALGRAALRYMQRLAHKPPTFRFDVIEVIGSEKDGTPQVRHLTNAFTLPRSVRVPW
jgi:putative endonuclease